MNRGLSVHNQNASLPSTSGTGPTMHSNLHMLPMARLPLSNQRHSHHHTRRRIGMLCIQRLRSRDNHRIRGIRRRHIRGNHHSHRIRGLAARH